MTPRQRERLRARFGFRCAYCGVEESEVGSLLTTDHFQPTSKGGSDNAGNWVYSCHACNEFKGDFWPSDAAEPLLHPGRDDLSVHFRETEDGVLLALTPRGALFIETVRLNRPQLIESRQRRHQRAAVERERHALLAELRALEEENERLSARLETLGE